MEIIHSGISPCNFLEPLTFLTNHFLVKDDHYGQTQNGMSTKMNATPSLVTNLRFLKIYSILSIFQEVKPR